MEFKTELVPYLCAKNAAAAIEFYKAAFGAIQGWRLDEPGGRVSHADMEIGDVGFMIADEHPEVGFVSPETIGGTPITLHLTVENADAVFEQAVRAGAKVDRPLQDQFYGYRNGYVTDPFGFRWCIGTKLEELTPQQLDERVGVKREATA